MDTKPAKLWNFATGAYEDIQVPADSWAYMEDMRAWATCPGCGRRLRWGSTYTSRRIFTANGLFGYGVCARCSAAEFEADPKTRKKEE